MIITDYQCQEKSLRRRNFSMVEITIALMILGTGLIAILGVFPIAATNSRDAAGTNYAAAAGEEMLSYMAARIDENWSIVSGTTISDELADISAGQSDLTGWGTPQLADASPIGNSGIYFKDDGSNNAMYRVVIDTETAGGGTINTFDGLARVWKSPTKGFYYNNATSALEAGAEDSLYDRSAQLNIEITWPAALPYSARRKAYYALEVARNE